MRQRNVKNKKEIIDNSDYIIREPLLLKGKWQEAFKNNNPIYLEIGMGKGKFILENALTFPNINFIGIEKSDSIVALAIKKINQYSINNLKIIPLDAIDVDSVFSHEISKIYLNFSDPWPKARHEKRRLSSQIFLKKYDNILIRNCIEMKTDNRNLFEYSLKSFVNYGYKISDISLDLQSENREDNIMTEYEEKFCQMNKNIYYVKVEK